MLSDTERALLAEITAMTERLGCEVEALRSDIAELRETDSPDAAPSTRQLPA